MTRRRTASEWPAVPVSADPPVTVAVRVKPGAGRTRVGGCHDGPHGPALIVAVTAPAVDGRATEAVCRSLAAALRVRPAVVVLRLGATSRDKLFAVDAPAATVGRRVRELRDGAGPEGDPPSRPHPDRQPCREPYADPGARPGLDCGSPTGRHPGPAHPPGPDPAPGQQRGVRPGRRPAAR